MFFTMTQAQKPQDLRRRDIIILLYFVRYPTFPSTYYNNMYRPLFC